MTLTLLVQLILVAPPLFTIGAECLPLALLSELEPLLLEEPPPLEESWRLPLAVVPVRRARCFAASALLLVIVTAALMSDPASAS